MTLYVTLTGGLGPPWHLGPGKAYDYDDPSLSPAFGAAASRLDGLRAVGVPEAATGGGLASAAALATALAAAGGDLDPYGGPTAS